MSEQLVIYLNGRRVGHLTVEPHARYSFAYHPEWLGRVDASVLSLSLPLTPEPYGYERARPFFAGLLPEGTVRQAVARRYGVSPTNDFRLLEAIGGECAGAVSLLTPDSSPVQTYEYRRLESESLRALVSERRWRPLLVGAEGVRLSLAGVQDKLPVYLDGDDVLLPEGGAPTSHILKPPIPDLPESVENEAFCMELAHRLGVPVPRSRLRLDPVLLFEIERYDRTRDEEGRLVRLHQEDLCQALGIPPEAKYEAEGGPSAADCARLLDEHSASPALDRRALIRWVIFNVLVGNADAHAKNVSVLHQGGKTVRRAPFYDLLSTGVYADLSSKLAMKIGGEGRIDHLFRRHWERLAGDLGVSPRAVLSTLNEMADAILGAARDLSRAQDDRWGPAEIRARISGFIEANTHGILRRLD
ncbi:MAG: type II toxin-antitoxin system HipA family toxin [Deltaproteobacteria bacterium]|nr:type II toxin-antitoxin system HipA family toxin [Deltaproteobacteria bacterium]